MYYFYLTRDNFSLKWQKETNTQKIQTLKAKEKSNKLQRIEKNIPIQSKLAPEKYNHPWTSGLPTTAHVTNSQTLILFQL